MGAHLAGEAQSESKDARLVRKQPRPRRSLFGPSVRGVQSLSKRTPQDNIPLADDSGIGFDILEYNSTTKRPKARPSDDKKREPRRIAKARMLQRRGGGKTRKRERSCSLVFMPK